jgi:putative beta-lysine N-acetyltransferase
MNTNTQHNPTDETLTLGNSVIQHGPYNDRVYLMSLDRSDFPGVLDTIDSLAAERGYGKIFVKAPAFALEECTRRGYVTEASAAGFYRGEQDAFFLGKFLDPRRAIPANPERLEEIRRACEAIEPVDAPQLPADFSLSVCVPGDVDEMAALYRAIFDSYPFPIFDPAYLRETMADHVVYFGVRHRGDLIALSSSEISFRAQAAEMTDFATLPNYRGNGLATALLSAMEREMKTRDVRTVYTIARAASFGMNAVFAKRAYHFGGTLINNTNIGGSIESMNVWHKPA